MRNEQNGSSSEVGVRKKTSKTSLTVAEMLESVVGCKWSMRVLDAVVAGTHRPGELQRMCDGISAKVLNERLRKLTRFGIVKRVAYPEAPPRVEYELTEFGKRFVPLVEAVRELEATLDADTSAGVRCPGVAVDERRARLVLESGGTPLPHAAGS